MHPLSQPSAKQISSGTPVVMLPSRIQACPGSCLYQITVRVTRPGDDKLRYTMPDPHSLAANRTADPAGHRLPAPAGPKAILCRGAASGRLTHIEQMPPLPGRSVPWPDWVPYGLVTAFASIGVAEPWAHQAQAANFA